MANEAYLNQLRLGNTSTRPSPYANSNISSMYEQSLASRLAGIDAQTAAGRAGYTKQIQEAPQTYQPLRNEAYAQDQTSQRALRERLANMGLGAAGGQSLTMENQRTMSLQNRLGDLNRQQQKVIDDANFQINQLMSQGEYEKAQATADEAAKMNQALLEEYWRNQQKKETEIDRYYQMFANRHITAKQFKKLTGITVQQARSRGGGGGPPKEKPLTAEEILDKILGTTPNTSPVDRANAYNDYARKNLTPNDYRESGF
jgi:hypothetical protein